MQAFANLGRSEKELKAIAQTIGENQKLDFDAFRALASGEGPAFAEDGTTKPVTGDSVMAAFVTNFGKPDQESTDLPSTPVEPSVTDDHPSICTPNERTR